MKLRVDAVKQPNVYSWEIPKGAFSDFDHTEKPLQAAQRELVEETGFISNQWISLPFVYMAKSYVQVHNIAFGDISALSVFIPCLIEKALPYSIYLSFDLCNCLL